MSALALKIGHLNPINCDLTPTPLLFLGVDSPSIPKKNMLRPWKVVTHDKSKNKKDGGTEVSGVQF